MQLVFDMKTGKSTDQAKPTKMPPIILCGGGGQSGTVDWPDWMSNTWAHVMWGKSGDLGAGEYPGTGGTDVLSLSLFDVLDTAISSGGNPWTNKFAFDPDAVLTPSAGSPIDKMNDQYDAAKILVDAVTPETFWKSAVDAGNSKFGKFPSINFLDALSTALSGLITAAETVLNDAAITNAVDSFETNKTSRFLRGVGRFSAGMADVNAVMSSAYVMGLAFMESDFGQESDKFERDLKLQTYSDVVSQALRGYFAAQTQQVIQKGQLLVSAADQIATLEHTKEQMSVDLARLKMELERLTIIAMKEKVDAQLDIDDVEAKWELDMFMFAGNLFAAPSGSPGQVPGRPSKIQSALSGALGGASVGAKGGTPGMIAGAALGFGAGLLG